MRDDCALAAPGQCARPQQRVVTLEQVLAPRYMAWLNDENDNGTNVYVSANPLLPSSCKRTKEYVASVRRIHPCLRRRCCRAGARLCLLEGPRFQEFPRTIEAQRITPTLRIRLALAPEIAEAPSKPAARAAVTVGAKARIAFAFQPGPLRRCAPEELSILHP